LEKQEKLITVLQKGDEKCQQCNDVLLIDSHESEYAGWIHHQEHVSLDSPGWNKLNYPSLGVRYD